MGSRYGGTRGGNRRTDSLRRPASGRSIGLPAILLLVVIAMVVAVLALVFPTEWTKPPSVSAFGDSDAFSPNLDQEQDTAVVLYSLSQEAQVDAEVLDESQSTVRTLTAADAQGGGQHSLVWDGRDDRGRMVPDGQYYVRITAKGSARATSNTVPVVVDTTAPIIRLANMPEDLQVREETLIIEGVTEPDAALWFNDRPQPVPVDSGGGFRIEHRLLEGTNTIELSVVDKAGNRASITRQVTLIVKPPDIVVDNPPDNLWINEKLLSVQGRVPPGTTLTVNGKTANVDGEGAYSVDILLQEGENTILFEATDSVGNVAKAQRLVFLKTRPPAISLTSVTEGMKVEEPSLLVVGQSEPGSVVNVNGRMLAVDSRGGFQGLVRLVEGDNLIRAEAVDQAGNTTTLSRRVVHVAPGSVAASSRMGLLVPGLLLAAGTVVAAWMLLGGWLSPIAVSFSADRQALRADAEGNLAPILLRLNLSRPATVTVDVWNQADALVNTLLYRRKRGAGDHVLVWDGRQEDGQLAPDGVYEVEASARTLTTTVSSSVRVAVDTAQQLRVIRHSSVRDRQSVSSRSN